MVACLEEIAFSMGFIDRQQLQKLIESQKKSSYGQYLQGLLQQDARVP